MTNQLDHTSSAPDDPLMARFELLIGRFIDGELTESEDKELVALLNAEPAHAKRFLRQMAYERLIAALCDSHRMNDGLFIQAVQRSVHLLNDKDGNERFAHRVIALVKGNRVAAPNISVRRRAVHIRRATVSPWIAVAGLAALVALTVYIFPNLTRSNRNGADAPAETAQVPTQVIDLAHLSDPRGVGVTEEIPPVQPSEKDFEPEDVEASVAAAQNPVPPPNVTQAPVVAPAPKVVAVSRPENATIQEMGRVKPAFGCTAVLRRTGVAGGEMSVRRIEVLGDGDLLRVGPSEGSPSDAKPVAAGVEVMLKDGTILMLQPNTTLRMQKVDGAPKPLLETGELLARVKPQSPDHPLIFMTAQGPEAKVVGTVLRVQADPQNKRVNLFVEEGKVQFSNHGESRLILADEGSSAEDGKAPTAPFQYRPRPGQLAGLVVGDRNVPVENAIVIASPLAQGNDSPLQYKTRTDAQGHYQFDALPDGPVFVYVAGEEGESRGIRGRGTVMRARVASGEKTNFNLVLDRAMLVQGRVTDIGKALTDYRVRLVRPGSDGISFNSAPSGTIKWAGANGDMDGFTFVALEGTGRYTAIVEKKGLVATIRGGLQYDVRPDRVTQWFIDASFSPSATLKGRLIGPNGAALTEEPGVKSDDPRRTRSVVTLKCGAGPLLTAVAEPDGTFTFDTNLDSGIYELHVERFGFQPDTRRITLLAGKTTDAPIQLKAAPPQYRKMIPQP